MENYHNTGGAKPSAWTARAGVVVDLEPPLSARSGPQRLSGTGQDGRPLEPQNSSVIQSRNYPDYEEMNSLPIMNAAVTSNMFMQTVNFDVAMKNQISQNNGMNTSDGQLDRSMETSMDLLEQQQAIEQARLLQRFKELRQMQLQQQELLMQQQKNQLDALKQEQKQVQNILAKQRQNKWGGKPNGAIRGPSNCSTPPLRKNPGVVHTTRPTTGSTGSSNYTSQSESNAQHDVTQSTGQLPRPVIYVPLDDETDEIKTNPDLFSDTNSYVGSLATTEEGIYPVPESASEASGDVYRPNKQKPLKCPKLKPSKHHRDFTKDHGSEFHDISRTIDLDEPDEGIGTQSLRSSSRVEHQDQVDEDSNENEEDVANMDDVDESSDGDGDDNDDDDDDYDDDDDDELEEQILEDEDDESGDENQNNTCIETGAVKDDLSLKPEDRPITGIGGKKTFEELLEEQLRAEEEKLRTKTSESSPTSESPKRAFLKKGVGLSRFGMTSNQKPQGKTVINKANVKSTLPQGAIVTGKTEQKNKIKHSADKKTSKVSPKHSKSVKKSPATSPRTEQVQTNLKLIAKTGTQKSATKEETSYHNSNSKKVKSPPGSPGKVQSNHKLNAKGMNPKSAGKEETTLQHKKEKKMSDRVHINKQSARLDPLPDDASFIDKIEQRERNKEFEQEDLEEFEMLEDFADNASFCSNSSIVQKVMERDRIKSRLGIPQSPRTSVAQQIALASRKDELKKKIDHALQEEPSKSSEIPQKENEKNHKKSHSNKMSDSSEEETSESEEESSELSEDTDDDDDDQESPVKRVTKESNSARTKNRYDNNDESSSASSSEDNDEEEDDDENIGSDNVVKSPSKIMTRKIASKEDRNTLNTVTNLLQKLNSGSLRPGDSHDDSLNSSSFVPQAKSPIVISRDTVTSKGASSNSVIPETDEMEFQLHSQFSSHAKHSSPVKEEDDKSDSEMSETSSYKALNISAKIAKARTGSTGAATQHINSALSKNKDIEFDDEEEWGDTTLKEVKDKRTDNNSNVDYIGDKVKSQSDINTDDTPPTSKLVTKLFPKLKPQPTKQQQQEQQQLQMVNTAAVGDGIQSKVLREKLTELEKEIEKFRNENATLERQRKDREEGLTKLKKEMAAFEKEKNEELNRIQEYKNEEMKKIKHERKMFEKYQKATRNMPDKKEREEIAMLKTQLSELQEEMKRKESRWTSSNGRLRSKLEQLEQENSELKEEIKMMEKKRLEWLQREQTANKSKGKVQQQQQPSQSNYQQDMVVVNNIQKNSADFQTTDSDEEKDPVRDHSEALPHPVQQMGPSNIKLNQARPEVSVKGEIPFPPGSYGNHGVRPSMSANHHQGPSTTGQQKLPQNKPTYPNTATSRNNNAKTWTSSNSVGGASSNMPRNVGQMAQPLRMSLMEDTPRQEPTVAATKQDTSMYSDGEGFDMLSSNSSLPRKKASKFSVDKSAIDKGSSGYEEVQHADGKVERVYSTGAREILFSNGTRKEISADGQSIVVSFFNGDVKQMMPDQTVKYYYAEAQTTHSTYPDGLEILQFPNNQVEKHYPDGTKEITFPDQTIKYLFPNGSEESIFPDGTVIRIDKAGDKTMEFPNGQREIHTQEYKRREYPDGTVKTVYPDGRQETRYSNGRIRVKDRDGNIIIDRRC